MRHYLDNAATAPMRPEAYAAITETLQLTGNASSLHGSGRRLRAVLEDARDQLAADLGCDPVEVVFTSGGTEADNLAVQGAWRARPTGRIGLRERLVSSTIEHPAVADTLAALAAEGADVARCPVGADGRLDPEALAALLEVPTLLTTVMWVNNELGVAQDLAAVVDAARTAGSWVHSDGVQALGHLPVDFAGSGLDLLTVTGHKVGGPVGLGALLVRRELPLRAYAFGGGQERDLRSGTAAPALAAGFAAAVHAAVTERKTEEARLAGLRERLLAGLPEDARVNGGPGSAAIVNVWFPGCRSDDLLMLLDGAGIDCSAGSACSAGVTRPSDVLLALGHDEDRATESLRFSLGWASTEADVDALLAVLPAVVSRARAAR
ncbi:cysteine desulfurase [Naumannella sp. ID2617S]|uniref:cysteine desulfurase n=1 Tax=Enemella dayhoffiae TaxID=2016507 RepID=A0A255GUA3_9ACTN|nr:cysteine desulfurase family protein [Enemella dayhoffiae]NNG18980.1 cysteine desulfurase [Naumannella sp. ID2617S]OYO19279.1 cysteine desulfurase NifS [Enemella dayhoffiae]